MRKSFTMMLGVVAVFFAVCLSGCDQSGETPSKPKVDPPASHEGHDHGDHAMHGKYEAELAKLSPEDRQLAQKQKVCPVSGDPLGSMGKPYKVTVQGRDVLLCCQGCKSALEKNPEKYLAKLPQ